jgi:catechol 2,3-dioxygenase-like lactoylglutathione lyase family enzyme
LTRLHHIALGTGNVERLAAFYRDVLGLSELSRSYADDATLRAVWLDLQGAILMIERTDEEPQPAAARRTRGFFLLALRVAPSERRGLECALHGAGLELEGETAFSSYTRDLDGNRIALSHHPQVLES